MHARGLVSEPFTHHLLVLRLCFLKTHLFLGFFVILFRRKVTLGIFVVKNETFLSVTNILVAKFLILNMADKSGNDKLPKEKQEPHDLDMATVSEHLRKLSPKQVVRVRRLIAAGKIAGVAALMAFLTHLAAQKVPPYLSKRKSDSYWKFIESPEFQAYQKRFLVVHSKYPVDYDQESSHISAHRYETVRSGGSTKKIDRTQEQIDRRQAAFQRFYARPENRSIREKERYFDRKGMRLVKARDFIDAHHGKITGAAGLLGAGTAAGYLAIRRRRHGRR